MFGLFKSSNSKKITALEKEVRILKAEALNDKRLLRDAGDVLDGIFGAPISQLSLEKTTAALKAGRKLDCLTIAVLHGMYKTLIKSGTVTVDDALFKVAALVDVNPDTLKNAFMGKTYKVCKEQSDG